MLKVVNFFRGYLEVRVSGPYPERFLNICARSGVAFWRLKRTPEGDYIARVRRQGLAPLTNLAERALCTVKVERSVGMPFFLMRFVHRYAFIIGMILCVAAVWTTSLRLWEFEVVGCETLSEAEVLSTLEELGVGVGTLRSDVDVDLLETEMLLKMRELRWFTINMTGSHATVELRERAPVPDMLDRSAPSNVVASRAGVIESIVALEGDPLVQPGATVQEGELLISGVRDMNNEKIGTSYGVNLVRARGEVIARTWYVLSAEAPLVVREKTYTGVTETRRSVIIGKNRINLFLNSGISPAECDKMVERSRLVIPGGLALPIVIETTTCSEYTSAEVERDAIDVEDELREALTERLALATDGEVIGADFEFTEADGMLVAVMTAEVRQDIAKEVEIPGFAGMDTEENG